eukprot:CAMPEP_0170062554 /NCGR_PEP_ID=MMETSP0019_2-20121128/3735_1 /TAXON_ID=98059 /ORGANISM="Dinobryon sp., Strain UTEXLB2267" /LENGTH=195 /DNA_ID=CAMNT_0010268727 /DNA_START=582 /DNA_END=1169 /DNA_ORIENTATION=-
MDLYIRSDSSNNNTESVRIACRVSDIAAGSQGIFFGLVFFYINPTIRQKWCGLLWKLFNRYILQIKTIKRRASHQTNRNHSNQPGNDDQNNYDDDDDDDPLNVHGKSEFLTRSDSMYALEDSFTIKSSFIVQISPLNTLTTQSALHNDDHSMDRNSISHHYPSSKIVSTISTSQNISISEESKESITTPSTLSKS